MNMFIIVVTICVVGFLNFALLALQVAALAKLGRLTVEVQQRQVVNDATLAEMSAKMAEISFMIDGIGGSLGLRKVEKQDFVTLGG